MTARVLVAWLALVAGGASAAEMLEIPAPGGQALEIERFAGGGGARLLWLPSERGLGAAHREHAAALAARGHEVWLADLHANYFVERGSDSIARFPLDDVVALIEAAAAGADGRLLLIAAGRGAQLALIGAREWQLRHPGKAGIAGAVLLHPYLYAGRPAATETADYLPVVAASNLPIYLLEAQYSTGAARLGELAERLGAGGATVYSQVVAGAQGGYFRRDEGDLEAVDLAHRAGFAALLERAVSLLESSAAPRHAVAAAHDTRALTAARRRPPGLAPLARPRTAPPLRLARLGGGEFDLAARRGRVLLVNFWATWCRPCVEEIPSLHRLRARIAHPEFDVIAVNVGEDAARIDRFRERVPIALPVLLDADSRAAEEWRVYVYPSNYLVDRDGNIRYAYLGALQWDSAENISIVRGLLTGR